MSLVLTREIVDGNFELHIRIGLLARLFVDFSADFLLRLVRCCSMAFISAKVMTEQVFLEVDVGNGLFGNIHNGGMVALRCAMRSPLIGTVFSIGSRAA